MSIPKIFFLYFIIDFIIVYVMKLDKIVTQSHTNRCLSVPNTLEIQDYHQRVPSSILYQKSIDGRQIEKKMGLVPLPLTNYLRHQICTNNKIAPRKGDFLIKKETIKNERRKAQKFSLDQITKKKKGCLQSKLNKSQLKQARNYSRRQSYYYNLSEIKRFRKKQFQHQASKINSHSNIDLECKKMPLDSYSELKYVKQCQSLSENKICSPQKIKKVEPLTYMALKQRINNAGLSVREKKSLITELLLLINSSPTYLEEISEKLKKVEKKQKEIKIKEQQSCAKIHFRTQERKNPLNKQESFQLKGWQQNSDTNYL